MYLLYNYYIFYSGSFKFLCFKNRLQFILINLLVLCVIRIDFVFKHYKVNLLENFIIC